MPEVSPEMPIEDKRRRRVVQPMQSAERLVVQKNVLLNGFDVSTENETNFNALFQKKLVAP